MCNLMDKINNQDRNRLIDTESRLTAVGGRGFGGWVKKVKGLSSANW